MKQLARKLRTNQTDTERHLWQHLRNRNLHGCKFRRQEVIGRYIVDFVCFDAKLIVELDGSQHMEQAADDRTRTTYFEGLGYKVLRFWNNDVFNRTDEVLDGICRELIDTPHPSLLPEGEGARE